MFTIVLAATDTPGRPDIPVLTAKQVAEQNDAGLHVVHVLEPVQKNRQGTVSHFQSGQPVQADSAYKAAVSKEIKKPYSGLLAGRSNFSIAVAAGLPWREILKHVSHRPLKTMRLPESVDNIEGYADWPLPMTRMAKYPGQSKKVGSFS